MRPIAHRDSLRVCLPILLTLVGILLSAPSFANKGLVCGQPQKDGGFDINLRMTDPSGFPSIITIHITELINVDAAGKAEIIRLILDQHFANPLRDTLHCGGTGAEVLPSGANGWKFGGIWLSRDSTYEDDKVLSSATPTGDQALCSLSGSASGLSPSGGPGFVKVFAFGAVAMFSTALGMPSQFVEQVIMQQLGVQGVNARLATPADFVGGLETLPHDANVLYLTPGVPALSDTALEVMVMDDGLMLDLAGVTYPDDPTTGVGETPQGAHLRLDVAPSVFTSTLRIAYDAGASTGAFRIGVHDVMGRTVRSVPPAEHSRSGLWTWDGHDARGQTVPGGVYLVSLRTEGGTLSRRVVRLP